MKDYLKKILNEQQYEAAIYTEWASLILAGAWAGKTRTLTYKIAYMTYLGIDPNNILAVTFTNKAANEMKERLKEIVNEISKWIETSGHAELVLASWEIKEDAEFISAWQSWNVDLDFDSMLEQEQDFDALLSEYDKSAWSEPINDTFYKSTNFDWIWTFHSIFLKILKQDIEKLNDVLWTSYNRYFAIADDSDTQSLIRKILKDLWVKDSFTPREIKWKISRAKNAWLTAKDFLYTAEDEADEVVWKIYQIYEKTLREQNSLDFDDLLLLPYILFREKKEVLEKWKNKFKYILVDEAQDTNKIQFDLIYMLSWPHWNITLIWDDFQSIYWWRWAVIEEFLNAKKYWPDLKIFKLETNYRSKKTIVEAWNAIIKNNKNQYEKNITAHNQKETKIKLISFSADSDEAVWVVSLIKKLKEKWKKWSDFAIIYRTNAQSEPFEKVLLTENIPYKIFWAFKFYDRREVKDILSYIKYIVNPADWLSLSRIINVPWRKIWNTTVEKIQEIASSEWKTMDYVIKNIDNYSQIWAAARKNIKAFVELMENIKLEISWKWWNPQMWMFEETKSALSPSDTISLIVRKIKYEDYLRKDYWEEETKDRMENIWQLINVASNFSSTWIEALKEFIDEITLLTDLEDKNSESQDQVNLMTVHASKWLEFDTVFLVGLEENIFPLSRARLNPKELEEERRLAYVWITRTKNNLFMTYAESRKQYWTLKYNPVSRFVEEIPEELKTSFNFGTITPSENKFQIWDRVKHKLFWVGEILEVFQDSVIVRFYWSGIKKILAKMLERV